jgi:hypothetical protein
MQFAEIMQYVGAAFLIAASALLAFLGPKLKNSPWLYVTAFSLMSSLGILVIKPKFDVRQQEIEMKQFARERAAENVASGQAVDPAGKIAPPEKMSRDENPVAEKDISKSSANLNSADAYNNNVPHRTGNAKTVNFLLVVSFVATLVGAAMLTNQYVALKRDPDSLSGEN